MLQGPITFYTPVHISLYYILLRKPKRPKRGSRSSFPQCRMPRVQILTVSTGSLWPHPKVLRSRLQVRFLNKKKKKKKRFRRSWRTLSRFSNKRTFRAERCLARRGPVTVYEMSSVYPDAQCQNVVVNLKQRGVASVFVVLFVIRFALYV